MVVFDTSVAAIAFDENAAVPLDPETSKPLASCRQRVDFLIANLSLKKTRVILPAPVVAEYIVGAGPDKQERLDVITNNKDLLVGSFDLRAAIECALIEDGAKGRALTPGETRAKVRFDRQVIAIAKVYEADTIYTGDVGLGATARANGLKVVYTWDLPLPPEMPQMSMCYE